MDRICKKIHETVESANTGFTTNCKERENTIYSRLLPLLIVDFTAEKAKNIIDEVIRITRIHSSHDKI